VNVNTPVRVVRTYFDDRQTPSDDIWNENFVVGDLPAGRYTVLITAAGQNYRRTVEVLPGLTNFIVIQTDYTFFPTSTPPPTPTFTPEPPGVFPTQPETPVP
jgi:hypothetical protein